MQKALERGYMSSTRNAPSTPADSELLSETIVSAVAAAEGVDPIDVSPRLYDVIDPDALEYLFEGGQYETDLTVTFEYGDWDVHIDNGDVTVTERAETTLSAPERR